MSRTGKGGAGDAGRNRTKKELMKKKATTASTKIHRLLSLRTAAMANCVINYKVLFLCTLSLFVSFFIGILMVVSIYIYVICE